MINPTVRTLYIPIIDRQYDLAFDIKNKPKTDIFEIDYHDLLNREKIVKNKWGIIKSRNEAFNHKGELAMSFFVDILAERNPNELKN